jgi:hypothetical protein
MPLASRPTGSHCAAAALLLTLALPLPTARAADRGQPVVYEGTVAVAVEDDFARGRATRRYFLDEQNLGQRFELKVSDAQGKRLETGARIRVRGVVSAGALSADAQADSVAVLEAAAASVPMAARKAVVMLVDIKDSTSAVSSVSADCDGDVARSADIMFGSVTSGPNVDGSYQDSSYGALGMGGAGYPGSTLDVVRVAVTEASTIGSACNYSAWGSSADKAAAAAGITLSNYQHRVYVLPSNVGCSWAGLAYVGCGSSCQAWVRAYSGQVCGYSDAYAHELGHNVGMWHASTDTNNDGTLDCEYCDTSDFMGYALPNLRTQNGPHKVQMGWASGARVVDGSAGGTFTVSSLELANAAFPQVVKVRPNSGDAYYLSYRSPIGYDQSMPSGTTYLNKINVHRWSSGNTRFIASLGDGQSYSDPASGVSFKQQSHTSESATFEVTTACVPLAPTAALSPTSQGTGTVPATKSYTVTVTNRDSGACGSSTFSLASTLAAPLTGGFTTSTLTLAPGASGTASLSVTAPTNTPAGNYTVSGGTASDAAHGPSTASGTFWIDTVAPTVPTNLKATVKANKVALSWAASTDPSGSGVARYAIRRGISQAGTSVSTTYTDAPGNGNWSYSVVALDNAGNSSAPSTPVSVTIGRK